MRVAISGMYFVQNGVFMCGTTRNQVGLTVGSQNDIILAPPRCSSKYSQLRALHHYLEFSES